MQIRTLLLVSACWLISAPLFGQYFGTGDYGKERWRIGLAAGTGVVRGEVTPRFSPTTEQGEIFFKRITSRVVNYKIGIGFGHYMGLNGVKSDSLEFNQMLNGVQDSTVTYYDTLTGAKPFYYSHSTLAIPLQAAVQFNLNRAFSRLASDKNDLYVTLGLGYLIHRTRLDVKDASGTPYDFAALIGSATSEKDIRKALADNMDGVYETDFNSTADDRALIGYWRGTTTFTSTLGYRRKLYSGMGIGLEVGYTFTSTDLLDNDQWENGFSRLVTYPSGNQEIMRIFNANDHLAFARLTIDFPLPNKKN